MSAFLGFIIGGFIGFITGGLVIACINIDKEEKNERKN